MSHDDARTYSFEHRDGALSISGLRTQGDGEAGLIVALHGGGYDARSWHASSQLSLLAAGRALGFGVVAVDRPGDRGSAEPGSRGFPLVQQADMLFDLIDRLRTDADLPVFLIGHSMGGILALIMAAHERAALLSGIDVSGVPLRYPADMQPVMERSVNGAHAVGNAVPQLDTMARRWMVYGEDGSFDPEIAKEIDGANPVPPAEIGDAFRAPVTLPPLMADITLPVQWTIAAQERSSVGGEAMLHEIRALLPRCPLLRTGIQPASGHNISLHHVGRAYHLRALAFFEECRTARCS